MCLKMCRCQITSSQSERTRSEADPTPIRYAGTATGDPTLPFHYGRLALSSIGQCGGRTVIVVVGVTPHQGARESRVQGKGR